jgi:thiol peroxidase
MAAITLKGNPIQTVGDLPAVGSEAPPATLCTDKLADVALSSFAGKRVLNVFPSIDTGVCALSVRQFNARAAGREGVTVLNISADLPFAMARFCGAEGLAGVHVLSTFRSSFATDFGVEMATGPLAGLCSRAVLVLDADGVVLHAEQVPEIAQEPDYDAALAALG